MTSKWLPTLTIGLIIFLWIRSVSADSTAESATNFPNTSFTNHQQKFDRRSLIRYMLKNNNNCKGSKRK
jgi:hypothetical protein